LTYDPSTSTLTTNTITATTFSGSLSGNASSASSISLTSDDTSGTYYLPFSKTVASNSTLYVDNSTTPLTYNPSTSTLTSSQLTLNTPSVISTTLVPYGLYLNSAGIKTYPTTSGFTSTPAYNTKLEFGTSQTITSGINFVYADYRTYTKSAGTTSDIETLFFNGFTQSFVWRDLNTCKQYVGFSDNFNYSGINANGRTSSFFGATNIALNCPASSTQTITTTTSPTLIFLANNSNANTTTTNSSGYTTNLAMNGSGTNNVINIGTYASYDNAISCNLSGALSSATIANMYGIRLNAPTATTGLTITNNWGIYSAWTLAKNYFAGVVSIGTTTPNSSAVLQVNSTTQGFLPPRMTGAQANVISSPAEGLMVYITDTITSPFLIKGWWGYNGATWTQIG